MLASPQMYLSAIDEDRFGIRTARVAEVTLDSIPSILKFCRDNVVILLIARCLSSELGAVRAMEDKGFSLMDTLVYYKRDLLKPPIPSDDGRVLIRPIKAGEENQVMRVAAESFRGYFGHYHADERLDRARCDEVYTSWAYNSCVSRRFADHVLVADADGQIVGFHTMRMIRPEEGEAVLTGISPSFQGQGIYRSFEIHGMNWCLQNKAKSILLSTQITNVAVQRVWTRLGFEISHSYYTFHKWFDEY